MKRNLILLASVLLVLILAGCNAAPVPGVPTPVETAASAIAPSPVASVTLPAEVQAQIAALKAGDAAGAITNLEKYLASNPSSAEGHLLLGQAYWRAALKDKAEKEFLAGLTLNAQAALPLETQDADELFQIGNAHASVGQFEDALDTYQTVLNLNPNKAAAYTNIGVVYYQLGQLDEAIKQLKKALEMEPKDAETWYMLGAAYTQQENLTEAEKAFGSALESKPDLAAAYVGLGNVFLLRKDFDNAVTNLQKATRLGPNLAEAWLALGQAYAAQDNLAEAGKALSQCVQFSQPGPLQARCQQVLDQIGAQK